MGGEMTYSLESMSNVVTSTTGFVPFSLTMHVKMLSMAPITVEVIIYFFIGVYVKVFI